MRLELSGSARSDFKTIIALFDPTFVSCRQRASSEPRLLHFHAPEVRFRLRCLMDYHCRAVIRQRERDQGIRLHLGPHRWLADYPETVQRSINRGDLDSPVISRFIAESNLQRRIFGKRGSSRQIEPEDRHDRNERGRGNLFSAFLLAGFSCASAHRRSAVFVCVYVCICIYTCTFIQLEINAVPLPRAISPAVETFQTPPRISKQLAGPLFIAREARC